MMGNIPFEYGDYLIIQGVIYQIDFDTAVNRLLYVESFAPIYTHQNDKMNQDNT
jgi:homogentisate 1,2-dioxygenase